MAAHDRFSHFVPGGNLGSRFHEDQTPPKANGPLGSERGLQTRVPVRRQSRASDKPVRALRPIDGLDSPWDSATESVIPISAKDSTGKVVDTMQTRSFCDADLAKALDALSSPVRLAIVRALEEPRSLCEIGVSPSANVPKDGVLRGRILARQTVKLHIDRLASAGIVMSNKVPREKGLTTEYSLNPDSLVAIAEAFHRLAQGLAGAKQGAKSGRMAASGTTLPMDVSIASTECP